jgi:hypothetical protein
MAHLHSIGAGGRPSADSIGNVAWLCDVHAAESDGLQPLGWPHYKQSHTALFGEGWEWRMPQNTWAFERAEALSKHVLASRLR